MYVILILTDSALTLSLLAFAPDDKKTFGTALASKWVGNCKMRVSCHSFVLILFSDNEKSNSRLPPILSATLL